MPAVLALIEGKIHTMNKAKPSCEGILMENGRITALGTSEEIQKRYESLGAKETGTLLRLNGQTVVPGLHDCHVHMTITGMNQLGVDMYDCANISDLLDKLQAESQDSAWVYGKRLDESRLKEKRPPTMAELDAVFPDKPVYILDRGGHYALVNRKAFDYFSLSTDIVGVRLSEDGAPNGRLHEKGYAIARKLFDEQHDAKTRKRAFQYSATLAASKGCTTIHAMEGDSLNPESDDSDLQWMLPLLGKTDAHVVMYWATRKVDTILNAKLPIWGGDILLDGSIGSRTAAFSEPYNDAPHTCGQLHFSDDEVTGFINQALENNLQIAFHAIGQKAILQALNCYERALQGAAPKPGQVRLEHFGFPTQEDIDRTAKLGVVASSQPSFTYLRGGPDSVYRSRVGEQREKAAYPHRRMLDAGIVIGGGSDSDITPLDPLLGMHAAVNPPYKENAVTPKEALEMFTKDAALIGGQLEDKGTLETGKLGDVTVLGQDPLSVDPAALKDIPVVMTIKEGDIRHQAKNSPAK